MTDPTYVALIGDIVGSRVLAASPLRTKRRHQGPGRSYDLDRAQVQQQVEHALNEANDRYADELAARLLITTGDEFQGLFLEPGAALDCAIDVTESLAPIRFRLGMGAGSLATPLRQQAVGMDGPCFHAARRALDAGKRDGAWITVNGFGPDADGLVTFLLGFAGEHRGRWTDRQAEFAHARRRAHTQKEVAARFGVSPSVVSESLDSSMYSFVRGAETQARGLLAKAFRQVRS